MRISISLILFYLFFQNTFGQNNKCNCDGIISVDYKGKIEIFDKPNGKTVRKMAQDFKNESYLTVYILNDSSDYFKVKIEYTITPDSTIGWIKKTKQIVTTLNDYSKPIILHSENSENSPIKYSIANWVDMEYVILKCSQGWVYVRIIKDGIKYEGWLNPKRQCNNPYTTCC